MVQTPLTRRRDKQKPPPRIAMDKRETTKFGHLRVDMSNISKAAVNPYYGREIPNSEALGLDPSRVYYLLRDPEELRKGAHTFNELPILIKHVPVTAERPSKDLWVGTTGSNADFNEPYLRNSITIWDGLGIAGIETKQQHELSSAYAYDADMTPGVFGGVKYDGVMRNIVGNHVALVEEGRAGPDVVVGDSKLLEKTKMKLTAKQIMLAAALNAYLASGVIAQDAQIGDLHAAVAVGKSLKTQKEQKAVVTAVTKLVTPHLAQDMDLDALAPLVAAIADADDPTPEMPGAMDDDYASQLATLLQTMGMGPDVITKIQALCSGGAMDSDPNPDNDDKGDKVDKTAMDAAITAAQAATVAQMKAVRAAEIDVRSIIGELAIAQDSAEAVYKLALDHMKVDLTDVEPSAYKAVFTTAKAMRATAAPAKVGIAQDQAIGGAADFAKMFTGAAKVGG